MLTGQPRIQPHTQSQLLVKIDGKELGVDELQDLLEVRVDLGVRTIGRASITFADRESNLVRAQLELGKQIEISSVEPAKVLLTGTITGVDLDASLTGTTTTVTVQDDAYKMARNRKVSTFRDQGYSDVVKQVAQEAGLSVSAPALVGRLPWLLQADSSLGLIDEIAERIGLDWAVSGRELAVWPADETAPKAQPCTLELGVDLLAFSARRSGLGKTQFDVRGWDSELHRAQAARAKSSTTRDGFAPQGEGVPATVLATHLLSGNAAEAKAVAGGLVAAAGRVSGRGRAHFVPQLTPGNEVTIKGSGSADGRYYVREVTHQVDAGSLRTSFVVGDRVPITLSDPWGSPPPVSSLRRSGLTIGIVDNVNDPDACGRVSVQLIGLSDSESSAWARVLALGGGAKHGMVMLPEVGDEVLVAFEDDDVRRPVVLGGLYSKKVAIAGPTAVQNGEIVSRHLVSRLGHSIELSDGRGAEFVQMVLAGAKKRVRVGKDSSEIAADDTPLTISSGGASITFDGRGAITIDATTVTIKAKQSLKLEGLDVAAKAQTKLEATGLEVSLNGSTRSVVKGGAMVEISGAMVKIN